MTLTLAAVGQSPFFKVETARRGKEFQFPLLKAQRASHVATKINQLLQLSELRGLADRRRRDVFSQAMINDGSIYGRKVALAFTIYSNDPRIFSVGFNNSMDGATTHWWTSYYNFNPRNGDLISLKDLFTEDGYPRFTAMVGKKRSKSYRAEVARKVDPAEREVFLGLLSMIMTDDLNDYSIDRRSITIDGSDLLGKSFCCYDLEMRTRIELRVFRKWLNEYGQIVFGLRRGNLAKFRSSELPQLFRGTADGKFPFVAVLSPMDRVGSAGIYAFLKYRKGMHLTSTMRGDQIQMTEHILVKTAKNVQTDSDHGWVDGGTISGIFDGSTFRGTWMNKEKHQMLTWEASRD